MIVVRRGLWGQLLNIMIRITIIFEGQEKKLLARLRLVSILMIRWSYRLLNLGRFGM